MLTSVDSGLIGKEKFQGSSGLGRGPDTLDWQEMSGSRTPLSTFNEGRSRRARTYDELPPKLYPENIAANDKSLSRNDTGVMAEFTRDELTSTISAIEERMDKRVERMERDTDRRAADLRRETDLRDTAMRNEQVLRDRSLDDRLNGFLAAQAERDKAQLERDKRFEMLAERVTKAAEGAEEAAKQSATVKANYWAAVAVQLLAVVAILVGAYYANQANVFGAMQTTMSAYQAGKDSAKTAEAPSALPSK